VLDPVERLSDADRCGAVDHDIDSAERCAQRFLVTDIGDPQVDLGRQLHAPPPACT
jgi:hypothetical protein